MGGLKTYHCELFAVSAVGESTRVDGVRAIVSAETAQEAATLWAAELEREGHGGGYVIVSGGGDEHAMCEVLSPESQAFDERIRRILDTEMLKTALDNNIVPLERSEAVARLKQRSERRPVLRDVLEALGLATFDDSR